MTFHRFAGIQQDPGSNGVVQHQVKGEDFAGRIAIIQERKFFESEVIDWEAVNVGSVESQADLID
jgi:hypothetical protein